MIRIYARGGRRIVAQGKSLRVLRKYVAQNTLHTVSLRRRFTGHGILFMRFADFSFCIDTWADFDHMTQVIRRWRNLYGAPLVIDGNPCGTVSYDNAHLADIATRYYNRG